MEQLLPIQQRRVRKDDAIRTSVNWNGIQCVWWQTMRLTAVDVDDVVVNSNTIVVVKIIDFITVD